MLVRTLLALCPDGLAKRIEALLDTRHVSVFQSHDPHEVRQLLERGDIDLLLVDDTITGPGVEGWVASVRSLPESPDLVFLAEQEDPSRRAVLLSAGCLAVLNPRLSDRELRSTLKALVGRLITDGSVRLAAQRLGRVHGFEDLVSASPAMDEVLAVARRVARADSSLLILGETGVGKERLARSLHYESARSAAPFVPVNCGAIPEGLLESELFGHEQGAFTGAVRAHRGLFEVAHRGTLFLDEVGELPLHLQVKLLRVFEDRQIRRVGGERAEKVDVRIIAATNRNLEQDVGSRRFRADLFYRLAVVTLTVPPLRERREDIPALVDRYLAYFRREMGKPVHGIDADAVDAFLRHPWPGNVRELINVLERAMLLSQGPTISLADLPRSISGARKRGGVGHTDSLFPGLAADLYDRPIPEARRAAVEAFEGRYLTRILEETGGQVGETARRAGISERSLYDLMRKNGLRKEDFKG